MLGPNRKWARSDLEMINTNEWLEQHDIFANRGLISKVLVSDLSIFSHVHASKAHSWWQTNTFPVAYSVILKSPLATFQLGVCSKKNVSCSFCSFLAIYNTCNTYSLSYKNINIKSRISSVITTKLTQPAVDHMMHHIQYI